MGERERGEEWSESSRPGLIRQPFFKGCLEKVSKKRNQKRILPLPLDKFENFPNFLHLQKDTVFSGPLPVPILRAISSTH